MQRINGLGGFVKAGQVQSRLESVVLRSLGPDDLGRSRAAQNPGPGLMKDAIQN